jgi:hypothetical protein
MINFNARFDGKVIVPEEPVNLPQDRTFMVHVESIDEEGAPAKDPAVSALQWMADNAIVDDDLPTDLSAQLDHYLYARPKRPKRS